MTSLVDFTWKVSEVGFEWRHTKGYPTGLLDAGVEGRYLVDKMKPGEMGPVWDYPPLKETGLFRRFAQTDPTEEGILEFANEYGILGGDLRIAVDLPINGKPNTFLTGSGEAAYAWQFEIESMRHAVSVWEASKAGDAKFLSEFIEWAGPSGLAAASPWLEVNYRGPRLVSDTGSTTFEIASERSDPERVNRFQPGDVVQPAWYALQSLVNDKLKQHHALPRLLWNHKRPRELELHLAPRSLIAALWLQFAHAIADKKEYRQCEQCHRWFAVAEEVRLDGKYCKSACRSKAYRTRQAQARTLHAQGIPTEEIAQTLGSDSKTVAGWVAIKG